MPELPQRYEWEDYLYPSDQFGVQVLRNKLNVRGLEDLHNVERRLTAGRQWELNLRPDLVPRTFDTAHWKAIHFQVFQDVYEWAGQFRTVDIGKGGRGFVAERELEYLSESFLARVREANMFAGRDRAGVVHGLTYTLQSVNIIHPFREGNGRTQRILLEHVAEHAGFLLDWQRISPEEQNQMMAQAFDGDLVPLREALERAVLPIIRGGAAAESPWPTETTGPRRAPDFWQLDKPGQQVLFESRANSLQPDTSSPDRTNVAVEPQHDLSY